MAVGSDESGPVTKEFIIEVPSADDNMDIIRRLEEAKRNGRSFDTPEEFLSIVLEDYEITDIRGANGVTTTKLRSKHPFSNRAKELEEELAKIGEHVKLDEEDLKLLDELYNKRTVSPQQILDTLGKSPKRLQRQPEKKPEKKPERKPPRKTEQKPEKTGPRSIVEKMNDIFEPVDLKALNKLVRDLIMTVFFDHLDDERSHFHIANFGVKDEEEVAFRVRRVQRKPKSA